MPKFIIDSYFYQNLVCPYACKLERSMPVHTDRLSLATSQIQQVGFVIDVGQVDHAFGEGVGRLLVVEDQGGVVACDAEMGIVSQVNVVLTPKQIVVRSLVIVVFLRLLITDFLVDDIACEDL